MRGRNSSRKALTRAERHRDWVELRRQGLIESEIAQRFGVSQQAVSKAVLKYIRTLPVAAVEDLRRIETERLEVLSAALAPAISRGVPRAIEVAVRISERRSKLLGLDAPNTHVVSKVEEGSVRFAISQFRAG